ncbi:hypothetical protein FOVG_18864 [Fusarium oxysporum f. sp. pisi HDV247]|uniref:Uncharacterized protein n=1 Tax=Fusarium oxysporum f. sp. pisi HDV247 TaxID=1080344 RepID=W9NA63_FUSOX|nr:hypothetical protein FOVG_18864 [Fusarium oxysporum f. sp. pisi HDV247]
MMTNPRISIDLGALHLDQPSAIDTQLSAASLQDVSRSGYGISTDGMWIVNDNKRVLWLPPEYRAPSLAVGGSAAAIGCRSGRVLMMQFSENGLDS